MSDGMTVISVSYVRYNNAYNTKKYTTKKESLQIIIKKKDKMIEQNSVNENIKKSKMKLRRKQNVYYVVRTIFNK